MPILGRGLHHASMSKIRISEIFASLQGEGWLAGTPSTFVRTSGCNLRCWFCDTRYASWEPEGDYWSSDEIVQECKKLGKSHVVITGGEPMIHRSLPGLCESLRDVGSHVTIETAGTIFLDLPCDLMSISPKLANSVPANSSSSWVKNHETRSYQPEIVQKLIQQHDYQLKFVLDQISDADQVLEYLETLEEVDHSRVLMMPQGTTSDALALQAEWLVPWCEQHDFRYCARSHIDWFGNVRGT